MDQSSRFSRLTLYLAIPLLMLLSLLLFRLASNPTVQNDCPNAPWAPAAHPHSSETSLLQPLWQLSDVYIYDENIALNSTALYLTGSLAQCDAPHALIKLSPATGELLSQTPFGYGLEAEITAVTASTLDHPIRTGSDLLDELIGFLSDTEILEWQRLVEFGLVTNLPDGPSNESRLLPTEPYLFAQRLTDGRLYAYPLEGSEPIWERLPTARHGSHLLQANNQIVIDETTALYSQSGNYRYRVSNIESGEQDRYFTNDPLLHINQSVGYQFLAESNTLQALSLENGTTFWQTSFSNPVSMVGLLGQTIILQEKSQPDDAEPDQPEGVIGLIALNDADGSILWMHQQPHTPSVAVDGQTIFAFANPNQLIALNLNSGKMTNLLTISPSLPNSATTSSGSPPIVLASNDIVMLYLPTSRQLFAFRFSSGASRQ